MEELCVELCVCSNLLCVCVCVGENVVCVWKFVCQVGERDVSDKVACERTVCSSLCQRVVCVCCVYESVVCGSVCVCVFKFVRERITFKRI